MAEGDQQGSMADKLSTLGHTLHARWEQEAKPQRRDTEDRWLRDLYQYRSEYTPNQKAAMPENGSQVFPPATRKKVTTIAARLRDMLFPPAHDRNWTLNPTPEPVLPPEDEQALQEQAQKIRAQQAMPRQQAMLQQQGGQPQGMGQGMQQGQPQGLGPQGGNPQGQQPPQPEEIDIDAARRRMAEDRAERMRTQIDDQLAETRYSEIVGGDVIRSGCIYGTGILKGPMVEERERTRFRPGEQGWEQQAETELKPYIESVSVWDIYPDMAARDWSDVRYVFQRHEMARHDLIALAERDDFDGEAIIQYVRSAPDGDRTDQEHDQDLRSLGERDSVSGAQGRYEVLEYWGVVDPEDLVQYDSDAEDQVEELWANVWIVGGRFVVKAVVSPAPGPRKHPYHAFLFDADETSLWGLGVPSLMRDDQAMTCAATRAMLDNAAIASGPVFEVNTSLLAPGEDATNVYPRRVFHRTGMGQEAQYPAIRELPISSHINEYLSLIQLSDQWTHEHTVPSYMEGQPTQNGAQGTASGLSMLMGAANVELKDLARSFDDGITRPFIEAMYRWNMLYGDDETAKGDYDIEARGSASLVQKEIRAQRLDQFAAQATSLPDANKVDWDELLRRRLEAHDLPDDLLLDDQERQKRQQQPDPQLEIEKEKLALERERVELEKQKLQMEAQKSQAEAAKTAAETAHTQAETMTEQAEAAKTAAEAAQERAEAEGWGGSLAARAEGVGQ